MRKVLLSFTAAALLVGCQQDDKKPAATAAPGGSTGSVPTDVEGRLARLEKKLDKITGFLKQAVPPELDTNQTYAVPVEPGDPVIGPADAKVTIVEAYEFLCPYCAMMAPTMEQVMAAYPKDVRIVPKYMLIHGAPAAPSGLAMCAAGKQGKAAEMQKALWDSIFPNPQGGAARDKATVEGVVATAGTLGLDTTKFKADLEGPECQNWLQQSGKTLQKFGVSGTPSFFINGKPAQARDLASFKALIDAELKAVDASGLKAADYYEKAVVAKGQPKAVMISPFDE
ncbi:MAG: thioredoxin domain-containing protein [Kofleriaceae bacterium]|jgi:protein-disulfide isomerase|nr:thioredoxin domain-containing protein [Kofleriaceae bacterium]MBP9168260.1 thioredoxin domain-containing protein [Kofleriaceae bacterium]MBP9860263.1 thioredoxin domain-containing protein [Kofleriaceae bacterium]